MAQQIPHDELSPEERLASAQEGVDFDVVPLAPPIYWPRPTPHEVATVDEPRMAELSEQHAHRVRRWVIGAAVGIGAALAAASAASLHRSARPAPEMPAALIEQTGMLQAQPVTTTAAVTPSKVIVLPPIVLRVRHTAGRSDVIPIIDQNLPSNDEAQIDDPSEREEAAPARQGIGQSKAELKGDLQLME